MSCIKPLTAYQDLDRVTENGKAYIKFRLSDVGVHFKEIQLPCGQCIGCRIDKSRDWALRCVHESSLYTNNCFLTLTYNDDNIPENGSLVKKHFQNFMKRLRKKYEGIDYVEIKNAITGEVEFKKPIRFFHCGEYGEELRRPHYHACIFNFDFDDKELWCVNNGYRLYRSESLAQLWSFGYSLIGSVTFESAAYVARYITKKLTGEKARFHYNNIDYDTGELLPILPEYITMSRRPGIGKTFFEKYTDDLYNKDFITHCEKKFKPPKYYDKIFGEINPDTMQDIKEKRLERRKLKSDDFTSKRMVQKEKVLKAKCKKLERSYENGSKNVFSV